MFGISDVLLPCGHGSGVKMYCCHVGTVVVLSQHQEIFLVLVT